MKYYYDDPIKAEWMNREYSLEFAVRHALNKELTEWEIIGKANIINIINYLQYPDRKKYVHPDSFNIFEPQKGDLVKVNFYSIAGLPEGCSGLAVSIEELTKPFEEFLEDSNLEYESHVIIQREGKVFFMPKTES